MLSKESFLPWNVNGDATSKVEVVDEHLVIHEINYTQTCIVVGSKMMEGGGG